MNNSVYLDCLINYNSVNILKCIEERLFNNSIEIYLENLILFTITLWFFSYVIFKSTTSEWMNDFCQYGDLFCIAYSR